MSKEGSPANEQVDFEERFSAYTREALDRIRAEHGSLDVPRDISDVFWENEITNGPPEFRDRLRQEIQKADFFHNDFRADNDYYDDHGIKSE